MEQSPPETEPDTGSISAEELQLAARNHGMPLEALRHQITPIGLHYLLIHYDIPAVDERSWRLSVAGLVRRPLNLTLDDIRSRPSLTRPVTFECAGNGRARLSPHVVSQPWLSEAVGTSEWTGTPLRGLLEDAGLEPGATEVVLTGLDRGVEGGITQDYQRSLPLEEARSDEVLLTYEINGQPLPPQHGFPLRVIVPGWYGMTNVKWLQRIDAVAEPFDGYQQSHGYRFRQEEDEEGTPVTRMMPRALMVPPGIPEFLSRARHLPFAATHLQGRAWSGWGSIERVEVSHDGGRTWNDADLKDQPSSRAWRAWSYRWEPLAPGEYELCARATDSAGNVQPDQPAWNVGGYANNAVQRIPVMVAPPSE